MRSLFRALIVLAPLACTDGTSPNIHAHSPDLGTLGIGGVRTLTFTEAQDGLTIPAGLSDAEYLVVVSNVNVRGSTPEYVIRGNRGAAFEANLRKLARNTFGSARFRQSRLPAIRQQRIPGIRKVVAPPNVGDTKIIRVFKDGVSSDLCESFVTTTGTVRAVGDRVIIVSDNASPAGGFTTQNYQAIADEFDDLTYPVGVGYFGEPSDIDDNARVIIYYTPVVNQMTDPGTASTQGYVGGFFFPGDLFEGGVGPDGCAASNEAEIFYILTPDPTSQFGNQFQTSLVREVSRGTVAHEFQHMINAGHRLERPDALFPEVGWLDEALAHFAEDATGRVALGMSDMGFMGLNAFAQIDEQDQDAYFIQNFLRARYFVERPDTSGPVAGEPKGTDLPSRGASWALVRYAADWFSNNSPRTFTRALAMSPDTGITNLVSVSKVPLDTLLSRWLVTLYTDHTGQPGLPAQYNYRTYDFRAIVGALRFSSLDPAGYPLPTRSLGTGNIAITTKVPSSSAAYFLVDRGAANVERTVRVTDTDGNTSLHVNGRLYIVRLR